MNGPDFEFGRVSNLRVDGDVTRFSLDNHAWHFLSRRDDLGGAVGLAARRDGLLFVSGDRKSGAVGGVAIPRRLTVLTITPAPKGARDFWVIFRGPPTAYHLVPDRAWFAAARQELSESARQRSEVLVSIDVATSEVMDVRRPG